MIISTPASVTSTMSAATGSCSPVELTRLQLFLSEGYRSQRLSSRLFSITILKPFLSIGLALMITMGLFYLMHHLIYQEAVDIDPAPVPSIKPFVLEKVEIKIHRNTELVKPLPPEKMPPAPEVDIDIPSVDPVVNIGNPGFSFQGTGFKGPSLASGGLIKSVAVAPQYPRRALARGVEGYVDIQFDVTAYGATENIRVTAAEPAGVFDRAAIKAVGKWKYKPSIVDGVAQPSVGIRERIRFEIER